MDLRALERLARLVAELDLTELEVRTLRERIRIVRAGSGPRVAPAPQVAPAVGPAVPASPTPPVSAKPKATIKAPLVGTFYRSPSPGAPPFVEVGQVVSPGQTVCIIEAMKIMNEIHADTRGRITAILVENAQPVEFGQVLMELDPEV